jgi:hypothetical protein
MKVLQLPAFVVLAVMVSLPAHANLIANGGFEAGFASWTQVQQPQSAGAFMLQTGTLSPVNGLPVPPPPEGSTAAMTDAEGPGSHVLYQDFLVPTDVASAFLSFSLFINNTADQFYVPDDTLDYFTPVLNQQFRVDIVRPAADPFSVAAADVLMNAYRTEVGDPLVSGYATQSINITALLQANAGQTLRLRFAQVDNVNIFNTGLDAVDITANPIPEPSTWLLISASLGSALLLRRRLSRS